MIIEHQNWIFSLSVLHYLLLFTSPHSPLGACSPFIHLIFYLVSLIVAILALSAFMFHSLSHPGEERALTGFLSEFTRYL